MAYSGQVSVKVTAYDTLIFSWDWQSASTVNNTTTIAWSLKLQADNYGTIVSSAAKRWSVAIDGTGYLGTSSVGIASNQTKTLASGTHTMAHNADGTKTFSFSFYQTFDITFSGANVGTISGSGSGELPRIIKQATITSAPNFTDEDNPTISYINEAGNSVTSLKACLSFDGTETIPYRDIPKTGGSYTFNLTDEERKILRRGVVGSTSQPILFYVTTVTDGVTYYSTLKRTFSVVNGAPALSATVEDINPQTLSLTGDKNTIVRGYSKAQYTLTATAKKEATIKDVSANCGGVKFTTATGIFAPAQAGSISFAAMDTRWERTMLTVTKGFVDYFAPTCNLKATAPTTEGNMALTISGNWYNGSFGAHSNGISLLYRIKANYDEWGDWIAATPAIDGNTYTAEVAVNGLDYLNRYTIQARVADALEVVASPERTVKTTPVFDWGETDFNFNVPVTVQGGSVDTIVEQGTYGIWTYRKWASGIAECWGEWAGTCYLTTNYAGVWYNSGERVTYPFTFKTHCLTAVGGSLSTVNWVRPFNPTATEAGFIVVANQQQSGVAVVAQLHCIGTWR